jgi:hypothetical protein
MAKIPVAFETRLLIIVIMSRCLRLWDQATEAHGVDALAITGDEGRGSLRKASGSRQAGFDPGMSEWGNPTHTSFILSFCASVSEHEKASTQTRLG